MAVGKFETGCVGGVEVVDGGVEVVDGGVEVVDGGVEVVDGDVGDKEFWVVESDVRDSGSVVLSESLLQLAASSTRGISRLRTR